jgi:hypothetical protein
VSGEEKLRTTERGRKMSAFEEARERRARMEGRKKETYWILAEQSNEA